MENFGKSKNSKKVSHVNSTTTKDTAATSTIYSTKSKQKVKEISNSRGL